METQGKQVKYCIIIILALLLTCYGFSTIRGASSDPSDNRDIGFEYLDNGSVVHIWNTQDDYYFNKSSGIQFTNHFQDYWTKNIFCIGYYSGEVWTKISCADELNNFNRQILTDNETYVNGTLWKDISYGAYDLRLGIQYHLGLHDENLSISIYGKNIGIDIPFDLGFAWKVADWNIPPRTHDFMTINDSSYLIHLFNDSIMYKDMDSSFIRGYDNHNFLRLDWNENLDYAVKTYGEGTKESFYTALLINAGVFSSGQEKSTTFHWIDALDVDDTSSGTDSGTVTLTVEHTTTGTTENSILIVTVQVTDSSLTDRTISRVTYGGYNKPLFHLPIDADDGIEERTEIWYMVNPPEQTEDIVVTASGSCTDLTLGAISLTGVDVSDIIGGNVYYFDGSDESANDPDNVWDTETNADDGDNTTIARTYSGGTSSSNELTIGGTTAPSSGDSIDTVWFRTFARGGNNPTVDITTEVYTDGGQSAGELLGSRQDSRSSIITAGEYYGELTTPSGGWSWSKLQALETVTYCLDDVDTTSCSITKIEIVVNPTISIATATGDSSTPNLSITTTEDNSYIIDALAIAEADGTKIGTQHYPIHKTDVGGDTHASQYRNTTDDGGSAGVYVMNYSDTDKDRSWVMSAVAIAPLSEDNTLPTYTNAQTNTTTAGASINFSIYYDDDTALHPNGLWVFSTNNTGSWVNDSAIAFTSTPQWLNVTKTLNTTGGLTIGYRWYANDSAGNNNNTILYKVTTTAGESQTYTKKINQNLSISQDQGEEGDFFREGINKLSIQGLINAIKRTTTLVIQSLNIDAIVGLLSSLTKDAIQLFSLNQIAERIASTTTTIIQSTTFNHLITTIQAKTTNLIQLFSLSNIIERLADFPRDITQSISTNNIVMKTFMGVRGILQNIIINNIVLAEILSQAQTYTQTLVQSLSLGDVVDRMSSSFNNIIQLITLSNIGDRVADLIEMTIQNIMLGNIMDKTANFFQTTTQLISFSNIIDTVSNRFILVIQNINTNPITSTIFNAIRGLLQFFNIFITVSSTPQVYLLDITSPNTSSPKVVSEGENITVYFNFTKFSDPITDHINITNITVGSAECSILERIATLTKTLQDNENDVLEDTRIESDHPDTNYGSDVALGLGNNYALVDSFKRSYIKYNLTSLSNIGVSNSDTCVYIYYNTYESGDNEVFEIYEVNNETWSETQPTWNSPIDSSNIGNKIDSNNDIQDNTGWVCFNVTDWVNTTYDDNEDNISFYLNATETADNKDYVWVYSKEHTDSTLRPYLNISYTDGSLEDDVSYDSTTKLWGVNCTIPAGTGIQDLTINATYTTDGVIKTDTESNAITYLTSFIRRIVSSLTLSNLMDKTSRLIMNTIQAVNIKGIMDKIAHITLTIAQQLNIEGIVAKFSHLFERFIQAISLSQISDKMTTFGADIVQIVDINQAIDNVGKFFRNIMSFFSVLFGFFQSGISPSSGTTGGGGGLAPSPVLNITLSSLEILTEDDWIFGEKHFLFVSPLDNEGNIVDLDNLTIEVMNDINYEDKGIFVLVEGRYRGGFLVPEQEIDSVEFKITARQNTKTIVEDFEVQIGKGTVVEKVKHKSYNIIVGVMGFFMKWFLTIIFVTASVLVGLIIYNLRRKRRHRGQ